MVSIVMVDFIFNMTYTLADVKKAMRKSVPINFDLKVHGLSCVSGGVPLNFACILAKFIFIFTGITIHNAILLKNNCYGHGVYP